jgi:PAS domain S-box-containing protein
MDNLLNTLNVTAAHNKLLESVEDFKEATLRLRKAFRHLNKKFDDINRELEKKNAELEKTVTEKEEVKNHLLNILESLTSGVIVTDLDGRIITVNRCAETFLEGSVDSAIGLSVADYLKGSTGDDMRWIRPETADGTSLRKIRVNERTLEVMVSPMKARDESVTGTVLILRDITRIERLEEMGKRTDKFAAMGEMAANIAHEIRNPLGSIELFATLLLKECRNDREAERLSQIVAAVKGVDNKISNLLLFTRKPKPLMKKTDINQILKDVIEFSQEIVRQKEVSISASYSGKDLYVLGDAEMLKQVFLNLILNAVQAMPSGGDLEIWTGIDQTESQFTAEVSISDTGIGISEKDQNRIFDPFFTGREKGAGLGLAIVHNIIDIHNGSIGVESNQGGTLFQISLPLYVED